MFSLLSAVLGSVGTTGEERLWTSAGTHVQITALHRHTQPARVHNLTVADIHTYYVQAGMTSVLVHNCNIAKNKAFGDAFRDETADFLRSQGRTVVRDVDDQAALTFRMPNGDKRILDMAVFDKNGKLMGYVETKTGDPAKYYNSKQYQHDEYLRSQGVTIDVVFGPFGMYVLRPLRSYMAYEVGVLCRAPEKLSPRATIQLLCERLAPAPILDDWSEGASIASCSVIIEDSSDRFGLAVHLANPTVFDLAQQAFEEGRSSAPESFCVAVIFTLIGDVWAPVRHLLTVLTVEWNGILFDEVSGFAAELD